MTPQPASDDDMAEAYADARTGDIKRRWLRRKLNAIVPIGKNVLNQVVPEPTKEAVADIVKHDAEVARQHRETVSAEIAALDRHGRDVDARLEMIESTSAAPTYLVQELRSERRQLIQLRQMLESDLRDGPITTSRDGRKSTDRDRGFVRFRARELRDSYWAQAEKLSSSGQHREARSRRIDALRARMIAEHENGSRPSIPGYGMAAWT